VVPLPSVAVAVNVSVLPTVRVGPDELTAIDVMAVELGPVGVPLD
jgi:hypothetical protein